MTIFIEIADEAITPGGTSQDRTTGLITQRPARQNAYLHQGAAYPVPFTLKVDDRAGPLKPGRYLLGGSPFKPGQFGLDFRSNALELIPLEEALAALSGNAKAKIAAVG